MISISKKLVPNRFRKNAKKLWRKSNTRRLLKRNYQYDKQRFEQFASPSRNLNNVKQQLAMITMLCHSVEKGLSLADTKPGFGRVNVQNLITLLHKFPNKNNKLIKSAISALVGYQEHCHRYGNKEEEVDSRIKKIRQTYNSINDNDRGVRKIRKEEIERYCKIDLSDFFRLRFSIRQFTGERIEDSLIRKALCMAQKPPSVCNRQSSRVHVFENDSLGQKVLALQTGNRGFGHNAGKILVVTSELSSFLSVGERNQCWIDGGMFAMSLLYALHSLGLGTCCLNWSVQKETDQRLRDVAEISLSESIIMMIAVGRIPIELEVAYSQRLPLEDIVTFHSTNEPLSS